MPSNELYLAVLPTINVGNSFGLIDQFLTLFPDRNFATEFFPDEVEGYIAAFRNRIPRLTGGHVKSYDIRQENTGDGRVIVKVIQNVE